MLHDEEKEDLTIVSTGSEVSIAIEAASKLKAEGFKIRIVSLPCWLTFDQQDEKYRLSVLRSGAPILSLEALSVSTCVSRKMNMDSQVSLFLDCWMAEVQP